ncbi:hypothetical protein ACQKEG_13420, partial [Klebsiella quasipneumoniae]
MPVFALLALVAYSVSLALIIPGLLQKNSSWRRMAILSATIALICHAFALEARIFPGGESGQNLSLLNVGSLVSLMICTVMTIVASRNRGWLLLPIVYAFALINLAFATFVHLPRNWPLFGSRAPLIAIASPGSTGCGKLCSV